MQGIYPKPDPKQEDAYDQANDNANQVFAIQDLNPEWIAYICDEPRSV